MLMTERFVNGNDWFVSVTERFVKGASSCAVLEAVLPKLRKVFVSKT